MSETTAQTETTRVGNLDMARDEDRRLLSRSVTDGQPQSKRRRWNDVDDDFKAQAVKALKVAMRLALEKGDHRAAAGCVDTLARLEAQNQADEHLAEKNARLDAGKATERVEAPIKFIKGVDEAKL